MATRALIGFIDDDRQFVSTYNHYDGYPEYLGKVLDKYFNDKEAAERVASTGYISSIDIEDGSIESKYDEEPPAVLCAAPVKADSGTPVSVRACSFVCRGAAFL